MQVQSMHCGRNMRANVSEIFFSFFHVYEAAMITEPANLVPLSKGVRCASLFGGQRQLLPLLLSDHAKKGDLDYVLELRKPYVVELRTPRVTSYGVIL